ncbi:ABC transporter ATP-binding protein [Thermocoleostomius sinensis]|jgi:ATP-binding cassette subfamily B protein|uniref:ABC transporter ATP-binding protein n=1 Tax=Thermocoleostomius sinensis A174 TaxID=2016057 RepID=A0A9E8ZEC1_9CYAN|nr:ABC transporter ATP-binding protein [Thermocoleostomius sinensis]WAL60329.1 ABC transporter ATP-binding protein [Thermocoleostomius sinensis A174]
MTPASPSNPSPRQPRSTDWRLFTILFPYARRNWQLLALALILLVPLALANSAQPIIIGQAVALAKNEPVMFFLEGQTLTSGARLLILLLMLTLAVQLALSGVQGYLIQKVGQRITANIRDDLFVHVTSLATRFFDRTPVGRLITRLTSDVDALGDVFSTGAIGVFSDLLTMLVLIVVMFSIQWQLALLLLALLLPVTGVIVYFQQQYRQSNYRAREELSALNSTLQENIVGINVVQLFRRESFNAELFRKINQRYVKEVDRTIFYDSAVSATLEWVALAAIGGVLWLGSLLVMGRVLDFGILTSFILFAQRLFDPLRQFAERFTAIQAGLTALERVSDILNEPIEIRDPELREGGNQESGIRENKFAVLTSHSPTRNLRPPIPSEIRFEHVWFGYKSDEFVLRDLDFTIRPGEKVALVGPTGAGKSSIIRLLCRLYEVTRGRILLDGEDIRNLPQAELRQRMAVILQDGFLFAGDVKSNIALGEPYSIDEIRSAAERTNVAQFIERLPQGYDTELRQRGTNLSGGEKQLLAFARAAIRNPGILVLDEATANLDVRTESLIQEALETLLEDRTAIIIAHRLSTIRSVDRILVLRQGTLVESGSHEELLEQNGLYASLYRLQMLES